MYAEKNIEEKAVTPKEVRVEKMVMAIGSVIRILEVLPLDYTDELIVNLIQSQRERRLKESNLLLEVGRNINIALEAINEWNRITLESWGIPMNTLREVVALNEDIIKAQAGAHEVVFNKENK